MNERNTALAEAIASGLEHIAKGLRQWAQAQRALPDRPASPIPPAADNGCRLVKVKEAAQILGVSTSTVYKLMNDGTLKKHEHTGHIPDPSLTVSFTRAQRRNGVVGTDNAGSHEPRGHALRHLPVSGKWVLRGPAR